MITVNAAPIENSIILDGNDTIITLTSSNGVGYYFRAFIYINDVLFDTQSWSRSNSFQAEKNLKNLYSAYFTKVFEEDFENGLVEQTHLKKKVNITIEERLLADDSIVGTVLIPTYYIMHNIKPVAFDDTSKLVFLGLDANKMLLPINGKISIPFYANTTAETIVVTLKNNFNTTLNTITLDSATAKKVFIYSFDLGGLTLINNTIYFTVSITVGSTTISKSYRLLELFDYPVKEIAFQNNFGYYIYSYFDGQMSIDNGLDIETYNQADGSEKVIEINEDFTYTINTGSLISSEKEIIRQIANAVNAKFYYNSEWLDLVTKTKRIREFQDRQNNYSENLVFSVKRNPTIQNPSATPEPFVPEILLNAVTGEDGYLYEADFDIDYFPTAVYWQVKPRATWSTPVAFEGTTSPQEFEPGLEGEAFDFRIMVMYNDTAYYSNVISVEEIFIPSLLLTSVTSSDDVTFSLAFDENFTPDEIFCSVREADIHSIVGELSGVTSPQSINLSAFTPPFYVRIFAIYEGVPLNSNEILYEST